jgi:hypothetical protein
VHRLLLFGQPHLTHTTLSSQLQQLIGPTTTPAAVGLPAASSWGEAASVRFSDVSFSMPTLYLFGPGNPRARQDVTPLDFAVPKPAGFSVARITQQFSRRGTIALRPLTHRRPGIMLKPTEESADDVLPDEGPPYGIFYVSAEARYPWEATSFSAAGKAHSSI